MADDFCNGCKAYTALVHDRKTGDTICSECGLVLESRCIDESAEWRTFADDSDNNDPVRVGSRSNPLISNGNLGTTLIGNPPKCSSSPAATLLNRWQNKHVLNPEAPLDRAFNTINDMADRLGLVETITSYAKELYKKADDGKIVARLRNPKAIMAACLYLACQAEGLPRTLKELKAIADGAKMKDIRRAMELLKKDLEVGSRTIHAKDIARRYCSNLGLSHNTTKAVQETVQKSEEYDIRRTSTSILAAAIFMVTQLSENKMSLREVAEASEVAEITLRKAYKDLCPHASDLIPSWYAKGKNVKILFNL